MGCLHELSYPSEGRIKKH